MDLIVELVEKVLRLLNRMEPEHWVIVALATLFVGSGLLRGFGSRRNY